MIIKKCVVCNKEFVAINRRDYKVCSKKCRTILRTNNLNEQWATWRKGHKTRDYPHQMAILKKRMTGENNHGWKGDNVGKVAIHNWIKRRLKKPKLCPYCKIRPPYDLANLNGHKYRRLLKDFIWLCRACHMKLDNRKPPLQFKKIK